MCKVGKGAVFFIALFIALINSHVIQASPITKLTWLPLLSANIKQIQLDKACPQNQINELRVDKRGAKIISEIDALNWDLNCVTQQATKDVKLSKQEKNKLVSQFLGQLSSLPDFELRFNHINILSRLIRDTFSSSLLITKAASIITASVKSDLLTIQSHLDLQSKKLTIDVIVDLHRLPAYLHLSAYQNQYFNGELVVHFQSDLKRWHQGEFSVDWQGMIANVSDDITLSIVGDFDFFKERISISTLLINAQQVNIALSDTQRWKSKFIKLSTHKVASFNYALSTIESFPLNLDISHSNLLTRVERGASKRIRIDKQKFPDVFMQLAIAGKQDALSVDWLLTLLAQKLSGNLLLNEQSAKLQIVKNSLNIKALIKALGRYVNEFENVSIESGEVLLNLLTEYDFHKKTLLFDSSLISNEISGEKEDLLFTGMTINSRLHYLLDAQNKITIYKDKQQLKIESLLLGIPIKKLQVDARLQAGEPVIDHFNAYLLGGQVNFDDFKIRAPSQTNINFSDLSLAEVIKYSTYPEIQAQAVIDGVLPLTMTIDGPEIIDGRVFAKPPGGYIKVPENTVIKAMGRGNPAFSFTMQLLSNFQFDTLHGTIGYTSDGESELKVEIKGLNPTVSGTQPLKFNYSHNENILKLLKSLRFNEQLERDIKERY